MPHYVLLSQEAWGNLQNNHGKAELFIDAASLKKPGYYEHAVSQKDLYEKYADLERIDYCYVLEFAEGKKAVNYKLNAADRQTSLEKIEILFANVDRLFMLEKNGIDFREIEINALLADESAEAIQLKVEMAQKNKQGDGLKKGDPFKFGRTSHRHRRRAFTVPWPGLFQHTTGTGADDQRSLLQQSAQLTS